MIPPSLRAACCFFACLLLAAGGVPLRAQWDSISNSPLPPLPPLFLFFPPAPTAYGAPLPGGSLGFVRENGKDVLTPEELADFVGETFYPMLGARLYDHTLSKKLRTRLDAYRASRAALRNDLQDELTRLENMEPAVRLAGLQAFAQLQAPRLAVLEDEADALRQDLIPGGFLHGSTVDWRTHTTWRLGTPAVATEPWKTAGEFEVARATAYFQDGLGIEQRGLLRELAAELAEKARTLAGGRLRPTDDFNATYFSPETAQLRWPSGLPSELTAKLGRFNGEKAALKRELLDVLEEFDQASDAKRARELAALTETQRPRIVALEQLAEEIRADFARVTIPPVELPPIPPDLRDRIARYNQDRQALLMELRAVLTPLRPKPFSADELSRISTDERMQRLRDENQRWVVARREITQAFSQDNAERLAELHSRYQQIRTELAGVAAGLKEPRSGRPMTVNDLLDAYFLTMLRFDEIGREEAMYGLYKTAMLEPGLSPAQRRLLFGVAQASLAQPLPLAEISNPSTNRPRIRH